MTYSFTLANRLPHSKDIFWDIVDQLESFEYFPDRPVELIVKCCRVGLEMARRIDIDELKMVLWHLYKAHVKSVQFEPRGPL